LSLSFSLSSNSGASPVITCEHQLADYRDVTVISGTSHYLIPISEQALVGNHDEKNSLDTSKRSPIGDPRARGEKGMNAAKSPANTDVQDGDSEVVLGQTE
jgi:hypothetical protein